MGHARPVIVFQLAGAQGVLVEPPHRTDHTHRQLRAAHFHTENGHRLVRFQRHVLGDVDGESGLAHTRASRHDDQIAGLQAGGHAVQIGEAGSNTGHITGIVAAIQRLDALDHLRQQRRDADKSLASALACFGNLEHAAFCLVQQLSGIASRRDCRHWWQISLPTSTSLRMMARSRTISA